MAEADEDFERARAAFRHASEARTIAMMRIHAERGIAMLERADTLSAIVDFEPGRQARASHDR
jgi:hypothetical protein